MKADDLEDQQLQNKENVDSRIKDISREMLEIITARNENRKTDDSLASSSDNLTEASIFINSQMEDKDIESILTIWIEKPGSIRVAEFVLSRVWLGVPSFEMFDFNIIGDMSRRELFGARMGVRLDRPNGGTDLWYYSTLDLTCKFSDGSTISKQFQGGYINHGQQHIFVF